MLEKVVISNKNENAQYCRNARVPLCMVKTFRQCPEGWQFAKISDVGDSHIGNKCYKFILNGQVGYLEEKEKNYMTTRKRKQY